MHVYWLLWQNHWVCLSCLWFQYPSWSRLLLYTYLIYTAVRSIEFNYGLLSPYRYLVSRVSQWIVRVGDAPVPDERPHRQEIRVHLLHCQPCYESPTLAERLSEKLSASNQYSLAIWELNRCFEQEYLLLLYQLTQYRGGEDRPCRVCLHVWLVCVVSIGLCSHLHPFMIVYIVQHMHCTWGPPLHWDHLHCCHIVDFDLPKDYTFIGSTLTCYNYWWARLGQIIAIGGAET